MNERKDPGAPERLAQVVEVARRLARPYELSEALHQIVDVGREVLHSDRASVLLFDAEHHELYSEATSAREQIRFSADQGIAGETLATRRLIRIDDCYADKRFNPAVDRATGYRTRCMISVPLIGIDEEAVGVMQLLNAARGRFDEDDERLAEMFAGFAALAIQRAQAFEDRLRKVKMERDLDVAREIQMKLLPEEVPACPGYDIAAFSRPAEETGGDIYDLVPLSDGEEEGGRLLLLLGDATGHGIGAAVSVTQVRAMLRVAARLDTGLEALVREINNQLVDDLPGNRFVTVFLGILDPRRHEIDYRSHGQAPLLHVYGADGRWDSLSSSAPPMGLMANDTVPRPEPIALAPGDIFVLLSDGFYEYEDPDSEMFDKARVGAVVAKHRERPASEMLAELMTALEAFANGAPQADDLTAVLIKREL